MSADVKKGQGSWISQKMQKRKSLEEPVPLYKPHHLSISNLIYRQYLKIKSFIIDNFPNHFSFHTVNCKDTEVINAHVCSLDKILNDFFLNSNTVLIISDVSIKNNVATLLSHIYSGQSILAKTIDHAFNIIFTEAELFLIRYGINQAI